MGVKGVQRGKLLEGGPVSGRILELCRQWIEARRREGYPVPKLGLIYWGDSPASAVYIKRKQKVCRALGIDCSVFHFPKEISIKPIEEVMVRMAVQDDFHGILVQLPLPEQERGAEKRLMELLPPEKDVDGLTLQQQGRLMASQPPRLVPCTPRGMLTLLDYYKVPLAGKRAVVLGRSLLVGRPLSLLLLERDSSVTCLHRKSLNLPGHLREAELIFVAIGVAQAIPADWIPEGAVVVDVGIHRITGGGICGDVAFEQARQRASWITPVPGGVGPMTVASLMQNLCEAYALQVGVPSPNWDTSFQARPDEFQP